MDRYYYRYVLSIDVQFITYMSIGTYIEVLIPATGNYLHYITNNNNNFFFLYNNWKHTFDLSNINTT